MAWIAAAIGAVGAIASSNNTKSKAGGSSTGAGGIATDTNAGPGAQAMFDNSGWNVTFGNNSGITSSATKTASQTQTPNTTQNDYLPSLAGGIGGNNNMITYAVIGVFIVLIIKKMKKG